MRASNHDFVIDVRGKWKNRRLGLEFEMFKPNSGGGGSKYREEFSFRFLHFLSKKTQRQGGTQFCRALILNFAIHYLFRFGFGFPTVLGMARLVAGKVKRKGSKASSEVTTISLREVAVLGLCN